MRTDATTRCPPPYRECSEFKHTPYGSRHTHSHYDSFTHTIIDTHTVSTTHTYLTPPPLVRLHSSNVSKTLKNHPTPTLFPNSSSSHPLHYVFLSSPNTTEDLDLDRARVRTLRRDDHVHRPRLLRPSDLSRGSHPPGARDAFGRHACRQGTFLCRRPRRGRRVHGRASRRTPGTGARLGRSPIRTGRWPSIDRSPDRLSAAYPSRARVVTGVARAMRDDDIFVAVARATNARARATGTSVGRGRARAVSTSAARDARS